MKITTETIDGIEIISLHGKWKDVIDYVDAHRNGYTVLFVGNFSTGGEAQLTKEPLHHTIAEEYGRRVHTLRGKLPVVMAKIDAIKRDFHPSGYGGLKSHPINLGSGEVQVTYSHSTYSD